MPEVWDDVEERLIGYHCDAIERGISKLHKPLCPNKIKKIQGKEMGEILPIFWLEYKHL